jgi:uncharacterized YccA/Bax inhibitor family protein
MRTSNPVLSDKAFSNFPIAAPGEAMTISGAVNKTAALLFLTVCSAAYTWAVTNADGARAAAPWAIGGLLAALVVGFVIVFKKQWSPVLGPAYALAEGLFLGAFSAMMQARYPGIVVSAVTLTLGTLGALLLAYRSGLIRVTENFRLGVVAATGGIFLVYMVSFIMSLFGVNIPYIHQSGPIGIGFSVFVIIVAALNLVLDFDFIENGAAAGAPRYMEWYAAFGLLVTIVWLYIEFVRLLAKLQGRR